MSTLYELPWGAGKPGLQSGFWSQVLGGWQIGGILTLRSGQPFTAQLNPNTNGTGKNAQGRLDVIRNPNLPSDQRTPDRWFDTRAFVPPPTFTDARGSFSIPGNEGRDILDGPGLKNFDMTLQKLIRTGERHSLTFRSEFFNLTNHPNFDVPGRQIGTGSFGKVSSAKSPRLIQFSLRYAF